MSALLVVLAVLGALPWWLPRRRTAPGRRTGPGTGRPRRRDRARVDVAVLLDLAGAAIGAGASVPSMLQALGRAVGDDDAGRALHRAGVALVLGAPWAEAWSGAPGSVRELTQALEPAWTDGADPGPLLARAAEAVRARRHRRAHEDAARLGVRLVLPLGLCFLPAFVLLSLVPVLLAAGGSLLAP
ncbi:type II secretion system F family protein [Georgenia wangjunii]|uniref:type II secretion system F family protein n=1 Tax=Georgenia wangjunii TaxID=3117730 RepID=UPI002F265CC4